MDDWAFEQERDAMVRFQLIRRGIYDPRVLEAMRATPRHAFVPEGLRDKAYQDRPLDIGQGQTISQPYMVAVMTQLLEAGPDDRVLEVGAGSGYQAAVLARIARQVITIERIPELADQARERLAAAGCANVTVVLGDGTMGYKAEAPYHAIIVTAGAPTVPSALKQQLRPGGKLICPTGSRNEQALLRIIRDGDAYREERHTPCVFVPLIGADGWEA